MTWAHCGIACTRCSRAPAKKLKGSRLLGRPDLFLRRSSSPTTPFSEVAGWRQLTRRGQRFSPTGSDLHTGRLTRSHPPKYGAMCSSKSARQIVQRGVLFVLVDVKHGIVFHTTAARAEYTGSGCRSFTQAGSGFGPEEFEPSVGAGISSKRSFANHRLGFLPASFASS
jgi:hypothetical protein